MIYSKLIFPLTQRIFWLKVKQRHKDWQQKISSKESLEITTSDNLKFLLYKDDLLSNLIYDESFEWAEKEWLKTYLKPGMIFYDIGANIGFYSLIAAKQIGPTGIVYALEPSTKTFQRLTKNITLNSSLEKQIITYNIAASDTNGEAEIYVAEKDLHAWNSLAKPKDSNKFKTEIIKTEHLDVLFKNNKWMPPDFIKIDVEGWEQHVLNGATELIKKYHPTILIEFTQEHLERTGTTYNDLKKQLQNIGYHLYEYIPRHKKIAAINNWDFKHKNVIAIKK